MSLWNAARADFREILGYDVFLNFCSLPFIILQKMNLKIEFFVSIYKTGIQKKGTNKIILIRNKGFILNNS